MFGALVMIVVYGLHPLLYKLMELMGTLPIRITNCVLLTGLIIDFIFSTIKNINIAKVVAKINQLAEEAVDKLKELKENASEKLSETKEYLSNTAIAIKLKELIAKYPNVSLRKVGKGKKRLSISEFIAKHLKDKDEEK